MIALTATCKEGLISLNESLPEELEGKQVRLVVEGIPAVTKIDRNAFRRLPAQERRRIMIQQAEEMMEHYKQDLSWQDWTNLDLEINDP
jgi:hypothetical protein